MNASKFAAEHGLTPTQVNNMARAGRLKARRIGFGAVAHWDIVELWEDFAPLDVTITSKGIGGWWILTASQDDDGFALSARNERTGERTAVVRYASADEIAAEYRSHTFDPTRVVAPELLP